VSEPFRFIHAADLHLDTPFQGIAGPAPDVAAALQEASLEAWDNVVALTLQREARLLVIAGDIYDGAERGIRAQLRFLAGLQRLSAAGVRTFIVHGNHDPLDGWSAIRQFPAGVTVFGHDRVESQTVTSDGLSVCVHGISYRTRDVRDNLALGFRRSQQADLDIALLHTNATGEAGHAPYSPCSLADLDAAGMDYWALGHLHRQQFLRRGGPWIAYSGDTQGRSPKPSETGAKGVLVAEVAGAGIQSVTPEPVDVVRFVSCAVDVREVADVAVLQARASDEIDRLRAENGERGLLVRVQLEGRGPVAGDLRRGTGLSDLERELRGHFSGREPFVWVEAVKDHTRSVVDLEAVRRRNDFAAELLKRYDELAAADPEAREAFIATSAELLSRPGQVSTALRALDAGDGGGDADGAGEVDDVLAEALERVLDLLEAGAGR